MEGIVTEDGHKSHPLKVDYEFCFDFIVVGGGIAGVSCVEQITTAMPSARVLLISDSAVVKQAANLTRITKNLSDFVLVEKSITSFQELNTSVVVVNDSLESIVDDKRLVLTKKDLYYEYGLLCLCMGSSPDAEGYGVNNTYVLRDANSVDFFNQVVAQSTRGLVRGNGGIATEVVYEAENIEICWVIKDTSVAKHYMDSGAAQFMLKSRAYIMRAERQYPDLIVPPPNEPQGASGPVDAFEAGAAVAEVPSSSQFAENGPVKRHTFELDSPPEPIVSVEDFGTALGPDWHKGYALRGMAAIKRIRFETETDLKYSFDPRTDAMHIERLCGRDAAEESRNWCVYVLLENGSHFGVDWILSAVGTTSNSGDSFKGARDVLTEGIYINECMHTSLPNVYAAGDVTSARWKFAPDWFQMKLWTQARTSGLAAGDAMVKAFSNTPETEPFRRTPTSEELEAYTKTENFSFGFEVFSHVTRFFGFKVVLLGHYNGFPLTTEQSIKLRATVGLEYIKVVLVNHRVRGALLIGETGMEETLENLILNETDVSGIEEDLLNVNLDLEEYFD